MEKLNKFELWHCLDLKGNLEEQAKDIVSNLECGVGNYSIDNEGILKVDITVKDVDQLLDLTCVLRCNIVIYGTDSDYIMTVKTMQELGLD